MNSDRKILRGVRVKNETYVSGKEDELNALLSSAEISRLKEKGYLEGEWSGGETVAPVAAPAEALKPLEDMKKDELLARAEFLGVAVDSSLTKAEIIEAIEGKEK